ncbi:MAG: NADH:flavin oxidoreductase/NADH oxidase family protein [Oligoflexia bacterium]|nr:NADH:flavin oxidoreductase/NADH oxidase family protein [Oligoflexia bacterium]
MNLQSPLVLPCGQILSNRLVKSAMSENMADKNHHPGLEFYALYQRWAKGGVGLCISGNVMVSSSALGEPNNVVIDKNLNNLSELKIWASSANNTEMKLWIQLNHPGKQSPKFLSREPVAPSSIPLRAPLNRIFNTPRELTEKEIYTIIEQFAFAAARVKEAGFSGVQIHGAHGYLVSQFFSPKHNMRSDRWGGNFENRLRFGREVYLAMRKAVGPDFPIGIKINSADFQKGGMSPEDSIMIAEFLSNLGIDLIEISGGSYESPEMMGISKRESTIRREAYFLEYSNAIKNKIRCPLMVTGGFRTGTFMTAALKEQKLDLIGLGRPLAINPNFANDLLGGQNIQSEVTALTTGFKFLDKLFPLEISWYTHQLHRMGKGLDPNPNASTYSIILRSIFELGITSLRSQFTSRREPS